MNPFDSLRDPGAVGQNIQNAFMQGQQVREQRDQKNALTQYAMNPNDPAAFEGLAKADPEMAMRARGQQQQQALAAVEQHKEAILAGAKIFRELNVQDEAGYQQALGLARQMGIPLDGVPPNYDPQYVQGISHLADAFAPERQNRDPSSVQEYEYAKNQGFGGSYMDFMAQKGGPLIASNGDGTFTVIPRGSMPQQNLGPPAPQGVTFTPIEEGGPTPQASGGFPR